MIVAKTKMEKIPECCAHCTLLIENHGVFEYCKVVTRKINSVLSKPDWCPLIEVKDNKLE